MELIFTYHHGISCLSQAKNLPFDSAVVPSMISSNCLTALSLVNSFSGTTFCKQYNSCLNCAGYSQVRCRLGQQSSIYCCWRTECCRHRWRTDLHHAARLLCMRNHGHTFWKGADRSVSTVPGWSMMQDTFILRLVHSMAIVLVS